MNKNKILAAALLLLSACAYKLPEALVLKIFDKHSFKQHDPEKLRALIRAKGLAGLKQEDRYAEVVRARRGAKMSTVKPPPSAGLLVSERGGEYFLLRVFRNSPAEAAGLKDGDKVLAVNSAPAGSPEFLKALSGQQDFKFRVSRPSRRGAEELEGEVKGGEFYLPPIFGFYEPETRTAFLRISLFFAKSASLAAEGLASLEKRGARNLVLDLRGNQGGSPDEAADLLALLADKDGPVLGVASRHEGYMVTYTAPGKGRFAGLRTVVLTDGATAMAAEAAAAALRETTGALVAGGKTAGNVSVVKTFSLGEARGLNVTVARLVAPSGLDLEGAGLQPDAPVAVPAAPAWSALPASALLDDGAWLKALELIRGADAPARR